jgi:hypothetical protein
MRSHQGVGGGDPKPLPMKIRALLRNWQVSLDFLCVFDFDSGSTRQGSVRPSCNARRMAETAAHFVRGLAKLGIAVCRIVFSTAAPRCDSWTEAVEFPSVTQPPCDAPTPLCVFQCS